MKLSLGRFGPDQCDLATMIDNVACLLRLVTININQNYTKRIPLICYLILIVSALCYIYVYVFSMAWFVFVRSRETGDFTAATIMFSLAISSMTCATKSIFVIIHKDKLQSLVQQYLEYDAKMIPGTRLHKRLHKQLRIIKKRVITVWSSLIFILICYMCFPIVRPGRHLTEDLYVLYGLEPIYESPNFEIALLTMSLPVIIEVYALACLNAFILIIIGYIEAHILALSEEIESLWEEANMNFKRINDINSSEVVFEDDISKNKYVNEYIHNNLKVIAIFHIANINHLKTFESIFRITMTVEFIFIIIAMVAELLGNIENTYIEIAYTFLQLYVNCNIGQKLIDASKQFELSVYESKWENFDKANMKMILLILQSAQKPLALTAGGMTQLDYICLMSVMRFIYTFYTTLQSTVNT